jgi:hypothetical protein
MPPGTLHSWFALEIALENFSCTAVDPPYTVTHPSAPPRLPLPWPRYVMYKPPSHPARVYAPPRPRCREGLRGSDLFAILSSAHGTLPQLWSEYVLRCTLTVRRPPGPTRAAGDAVIMCVTTPKHQRRCPTPIHDRGHSTATTSVPPTEPPLRSHPRGRWVGPDACTLMTPTRARASYAYYITAGGRLPSR